MDLPILGVDNLMPVPDVLGDPKPHFFKFWDTEYVSNPLLFDPTFNRTKSYLFYGGCIPFFEMYKQPSITFLNEYKNFLVVQLVVCGADSR